MRETGLTIDRLRETLTYDSATGFFTWKIMVCKKLKPGTRAGSESERGYRLLALDGHLYYEHRLAWFYVHGVWPKEDVDHINRIRHDNRISNLREASRKQNLENREEKGQTNTSGFRGVNLHKGKYWRAFIGHNGKRIHLGYFKTPEEAKVARLAAEARMFTHSGSPSSS
jgi:HNH endonuclease